MCGICGMFSVSESSTPDLGVLRAMNECLVHRGPDSAGELVEGPLAMAMRRLSIIDLAGGDQPIGSEDGSIQVIQNGEIYNYRELGEELRGSGHRLRTRSDTEVIAHLYEEHGLGFAQRLRGMFAAAVWDSRRRRLVIARDRYGIKPLYYRERNGQLSFASELKALLRQPDFSREIDLGALEAYLAMNFVPAPMTIFRDARKLPPGHLLICEGGSVRIEPYAIPRPVPASEVRTEDSAELAEELRARLRDSVRAHLIADVPVGVLLSGGVDSGALTALAAEQSEQVKTFTIGFKEAGWSEDEPARLVAERFSTEHHELIVEPDAVEMLPKIVEIFDEPFADNSALPTYLVSQLAASEVKVVLSGEGGDELFGGYFSYVGDLWAPRIGPGVTALRSVIERLPSGSGSARLEDRLKRFARGAHLAQPDRHVSWSQVFSPEMRDRLLVEREGGDFDPLAAHRERWRASVGAQELSRAQDLDLGIYMVDNILVKIDRASMACSLESRVPFLDPEVADFALALPANQKLRGLSKKRLLRQAVAPLLPKEIVNARKRGFALPVASWFRGELLPFARDVLSAERIEAQGLLDPAAVSATIDVHVSGREDLSRNIWGLICLSLWYDRYGR